MARTAARWVYSFSKALTEHLTFAFARVHRLDATVVRYFNVYGPRQRPAYVVSRSVHRALNGHPPVVYDGGRQTRCLTYVSDVVNGTILAGTNPNAVGQDFNIGGMSETTIGETVRMVAKLTGHRAPLVAVDTAKALGDSYEDLLRRVPDNAKVKTMLGWTCDTTLESGLAKTIAWARANPWWLAQADSGAG
jgi:dTDP-alpha-D-glucuronic acid decarboxylase